MAETTTATPPVTAAELIREMATTQDQLRDCPRLLTTGAPNHERERLLGRRRHLQALLRRRALVLRHTAPGGH